MTSNKEEEYHDYYFTVGPFANMWRSMYTLQKKNVSRNKIRGRRDLQAARSSRAREINEFLWLCACTCTCSSVRNTPLSLQFTLQSSSATSYYRVLRTCIYDCSHLLELSDGKTRNSVYRTSSSITFVSLKFSLLDWVEPEHSNLTMILDDFVFLAFFLLKMAEKIQEWKFHDHEVFSNNH